VKKDLSQYISNIETEQKQEDSRPLMQAIEEESGFKPYLTGSIVGF
jgi:hypothetical protein